ncbi:glycosyltransferase family 2 protein [Candidatus Woesearchaeota archaeon]|jgi:glycosyltransferase involved in cell wall biosynthesis|nr:glycosyltransferase family 2 protein [Candidatus Woesearchaeota archaeon]MBT4110587.1 glycosyltransferase family 2 protein [Candidatus Woesearchaeota archaeon]MBT4335889.1 glycosyltransferase family 2 protein [Candidatus Woesearchaeota archaeon]MBT4469132.1 glycosyltransferase family 2 protein [Candidatus Woesearchaeota archaeon]MBT6744549.1 glycosyltransferase family 2 protein [Candidatus Woesearchaeota archaeon]
MNYVVIPAHNEEKHLEQVIDTTKKNCENIIVVDDGSKDKTSEIAKKKGVLLLKLKVNLGKGAALKTGCDYAYINGAKKIVVMDADGQHNPNQIPLFLNNLDNHDIIFGYRQRSKDMPAILRFGNWFINKTVSILYNVSLNDTQSGYRSFTNKTYKKIRWQASDYSMESEMIANTGKHKLRYKQIPIETIYSDNYKGTTVIDGIKIVLKTISWRLLK